MLSLPCKETEYLTLADKRAAYWNRVIDAATNLRHARSIKNGKRVEHCLKYYREKLAEYDALPDCSLEGFILVSGGKFVRIQLILNI